ncbi:GtrA family protein [Blastococcus sp. KM273129]|uniref:GtrA family protein n=1 Tax=Blastococcus sp. KM273129 TaxID=2570315 RepID=UPI001F28AC2F|nr:GtrA family protein [Blastococcus sp. KM273129]
MGPIHRLRGLLRRGERRLARELGAFGVVGAACFLVDLGLFQLLYAHLDAGAVTAKLVAGVVSTSLAFLGHRFWSFSRRARTGLPREYSLFALVNVATLLLSLGIVALVRYPLGQESAVVLQAANVVAIAVGTVVRFVVYRRWVFPAGVADRPGRPSAEVTTGRL